MSDYLIGKQEKRDREFDDSGYQKPMQMFGEIKTLSDKLQSLVDSKPMDFLGK